MLKIVYNVELLQTNGLMKINSELRTQKFIQHNSQRLSASNNANLLL